MKNMDLKISENHFIRYCLSRHLHHITVFYTADFVKGQCKIYRKY